MNLYNETKDILRKYNISANKKLGQNFLIDEEAIDGILEAANITKQDLINVEIAIAASALVGIIILIARYKLNGLIAGFAYIGLAAIYVYFVPGFIGRFI